MREEGFGIQGATALHQFSAQIFAPFTQIFGGWDLHAHGNLLRNLLKGRLALFNIHPMRKLLSFIVFMAPLAAAALSQDEWFLHARDAYRANSTAKLNPAVANLKGHVLEPYARYWQLQMKLDQAQPGEIGEFLNRYEGSYVAEQLRKDWLKQTGKRQQWELFEAALGNLVSDDPDVNCYRAQRQWRQTNRAGVLTARGFWEAPREIPEGCLPIIEAEIASGGISNDQIWARVRLLWDAGERNAVQRALNYLPAAETPEEKQRAEIARNPGRFIARADKLDFNKRLNREFMIYALMREAADDPEVAAAHWDENLRVRFSPADRAYVWNQLATRAAKRHLPQAGAWFKEGEGGALNTEQQQWRVRAALRAGDWPVVFGTVEGMPENLRNEPTWVYWQARALTAMGERERAAMLYTRIAGNPHFYGRLAQEELGAPLAIPPVGHVPTTEELSAAMANPGLRRAMALFRSDMWLEGVREWNWTIRDMNDQQLLAAAEIARQAQLWDRAINTADRTVDLHDYSLRYLAPYREHFAARAREQGLEETWVLGLVRQESRFVAHARSAAGAQGLMQVMPRTAKWVAKQMGMKGYRPGMASEVETNITLGTGYLRYVLDQLEGSPVLAAAAYNAGPGRARKWKADVPLEGAIYVESIPFSETRDYVKKVMTNSLYYAALSGGQPRGLREQLGVIPPRQGGEGYAATITGEPTVQ